MHPGIFSRILRRSFVVFTCLTLSSIGLSHANSDQEFVPNRILIKPQAGVSKANFHALMNRFGAKSQKEIPQIGIHVVELPPQADERAFQAMMARRSDIKFAELDYVLTPANFTVNDPEFGKQWHLSKIQAPEAWVYGQGQDVIIAVIDTGVDSAHPELGGNVIAGWNVVDGNTDTSPADVFQHGTKIACIAAAQMNDGLGVAGVAGQAKIMPIRIVNPLQAATVSHVVSGIIWAADHGADVLNVSYAYIESGSIEDAAQYARNAGAILVMPSGNGNYGLYNDFSPTPYSIIVSGTTETDAFASFVNYGPYVDISAPGANVWTMNMIDETSYNYWGAYGSSYAAAIVSGVAALIKSVNPNLTPDEIENILFSSVDDLGSAGKDIYFGHGRINAAKAVAMARSMDTVANDTQAPSVEVISPAEADEVSGDVLVQVAASDNVGVTRVDLYVDGGFYASSGQSPFAFFWDTSLFPDGNHALTAEAFDAAGHSSTSQTYSVTVNNNPVYADVTSPVIMIVGPSDGDTVKGSAQISGYATDDVGLKSVRLYIDGALVLDNTAVGVTESFGMYWNAYELLGSHTIMAQSEDMAGNVASHTITVSVLSIVTDSEPPSANILSPAEGEEVSGDVLVEVGAYDNAGVARVDLYLGSQVLGSSDQAPFTFLWDTTLVSDGAQSLLAKVYDTSGNNVFSPYRRVTVKNTRDDVTVPTVSITSPAEGEALSGTINVHVAASDNVGVARVELYVNGILRGSNTQSPFTFSWDTLLTPDGSYTVTAKAFDAAGNSSMSAVRHVKVSNHPVSEDVTAPTVRITSHEDGSTVSGQVYISATATDNAGLKSVSLAIDGKTVVNYTAGGTSLTYGMTWNTRKLSGAHTITAQSEDMAGNIASHTITVTVGKKSNTDDGSSDFGGPTKGGRKK